MNRQYTFRLSMDAFREHQEVMALESKLTPKELEERRQTLAHFHTTPPGTRLLATGSGTVTMEPENAEAWKEAREQGDVFVEGVEKTYKV